MIGLFFFIDIGPLVFVTGILTLLKKPTVPFLTY